MNAQHHSRTVDGGARPTRTRGCFVWSGLVLLIGLSLALTLWWVLGPDSPLQTWEVDRPVGSLAFSPDGQLLAVPTEGVALHRVSDGGLVQVLKGPDMSSVAFNPDGRLLAGGGEDGVTRVWEMPSGQLVYMLERHRKRVRSVAFSPDGQLLASGGWDGDVRLWDVRAGQLVRTLTVNPSAGVRQVVFSADGRLLAAAANGISLWLVNDGRLVRLVDGEGVAFSPDNQFVTTDDRLLRVSDGSLVRRYVGSDFIGQINDVVMSPDGQLVSVAVGRIGGLFGFKGLGIFQDVPIDLWRVPDGKIIQRLEGHRDGTTSLAFSPDGRLLASGGDDSTVRIWQVGSTQPQRLLVFGGVVGSVAVALGVLGLWRWRMWRRHTPRSAG